MVPDGGFNGQGNQGSGGSTQPADPAGPTRGAEAVFLPPGTNPLEPDTSGPESSGNNKPVQEWLQTTTVQT